MTASMVRCNDEQKGAVSISLRTTTVEGGLKMTVQLTHSDTHYTVTHSDTERRNAPLIFDKSPSLLSDQSQEEFCEEKTGQI